MVDLLASSSLKLNINDQKVRLITIINVKDFSIPFKHPYKSDFGAAIIASKHILKTNYKEKRILYL